MVKQVLFLHNEQIVALGIESQLQNAKGLNLKTIPAGDEKAIIEEIQRHQPEIIIANSNTHFLTNPWLEKHFKASPQLKIIVVQVEKNYIQVFQKREYEIIKGSDLISAIQ